MKKILILILLMPIMVIGMTCDIIEDTQTTEERDLTCDSEKSIMTKYETKKEVELLKNDVCTIKCTEEIVFSIDPIKKALAGTGFNYPLYASGVRTCYATYDINAYETKIRNLVNEYQNLRGVQKQNKKNEITNFYENKKKCDEFTKEGSTYQKKYSYNGDVKLELQTSEKTETIPYRFKEISDYISQVTYDEVTYSACDYDEVNIKCKESDKAINGWSEVAMIYGKYTMGDVYLEKYTGEVKELYNEATCNAGDKYFTSLTELTRPVEGDNTDKGYSLILTATKLGDNLGGVGNDWSINAKCWYQVKNLIFPQKNTGGSEDDNYDEYGNTAFQYRIIDLNNPFPGREPGANWKGHENIIYSTKNDLSTLQRFVIALDRSSIIKIREYNKLYKYDTFNLNEMEKSHFIEENIDIIDRK